MRIQIGFFTYPHKLTKAIHGKEVPQFLIGIHKHNFAADFPHMFEQAQDFPYSRTVNKGDVLEIDNNFAHPFIHDRVQLVLENRAAFKRDFSFNADYATFSKRINLDVHGYLGQNTVIFQRQEQASETCHVFRICDSSS